MPISHQSYIHKPLDYTQPVDLNLLGKVLQFKQGEFDSGVKQVQSHIDTLASMDVAKDTDKEYLNAKLNNLVSTVNNIGGVDFSDDNVTNQIAGLSSQIYGDDKVISAVANTKKLRYIQSYYKDLKEKKPKEYNPANEWYDMNKFSGWLNDGQVGSSPEAGAGSATPFVDYEKDWSKLFEKMTANMRTEITDKGLMYRLDTQKYVSPEQIWDAASKLLTPAQRQQLGVEGRFTYQGLPIDQLTKAYSEDIYRKVGDVKQQLEDYQAKYKGSTNVDDQNKYQKLIDEKQNEVNALLAPIKKNAEQIKEKLYTNEKLSGLASRYSFNQTTSKLQAATDKMFVQKMNLEQQKFQYQQNKDRIDQTIDLLDKGLMWATDAHGNTTIVRDPNAPKKGKGTNADGSSDYSNLASTDNSMSDEGNAVSEDKLIDRKTELFNANKKALLDFAKDLGWKKGDAETFVTDLMDDGNLSVKPTPEMQAIADSMMKAYQAMANGEKINYEELPKGFYKYAQTYQENLVELNAIDKTMADVDKQVRATGAYSKLLATQKDAYVMAGHFQQELNKINEKYPESITSGGGFTMGTSSGGRDANYYKERNALIAKYQKMGLANPVQTATEAVSINQDVAKEKERLFKTYSDRFNMPQVSQDDDKDKNVAKRISSIARTSSQVYDLTGKPLSDNREMSFEKIKPVNKGYGYFKTAEGGSVKPYLEFEYREKEGDKASIRRVILEPTTALQLGLGSELKPMQGYNLALRLQGQIPKIITTSGRDYQLKFDIVKHNPESLDNSNLFVRVYDGNNPIILDNDNRSFSSYEQAINFMESMTKYKDVQRALEVLKEEAKK